MNAIYPLLTYPLHNVYSTIAALIFVGYLGGYLARLVHLPTISGNIIGGILLGPIFGIVNTNSDYMMAQLEPIANLAFSLIAISIGSHLKFRLLHNSIKRILVIALVQAMLVPLVVCAGIFFTYNFFGAQYSASEVAIYLAVFSIATAPATVVHVVKENHAKGMFVKTLLAVVVLNNVSNIIIFEFCKELIYGGAFSDEFSGVLLKILGAGLLGLIIAGALAFLRKHIFSRKKEVVFSFASLMIAFGLATELALSPALTNLTVGVLLANFSDRNQILDVFEDFEELIYSLFFTLTGAHALFDNLSTVGAICVAYTLLRAVGNLLSIYVSGRLTPLPKRVYKYLGLSLLPQGGITVGLIVALETLSNNEMVSNILTPVVLISVTLTEVIGPLILKISLKKTGEKDKANPRLIDFIQEEFITLDLGEKSKQETLIDLVEFLFSTHPLDRNLKLPFLQQVLKREKQASTVITNGVSIPHGSVAGISKVMGVMAVLKEGLTWDEEEGQKVHIAILLISPEDKPQLHLKAISAVSSLLIEKRGAIQSILEAKTASDVYELLNDETLESLNEFLEEERVRV